MKTWTKTNKVEVVRCGHCKHMVNLTANAKEKGRFNCPSCGEVNADPDATKEKQFEREIDLSLGIASVIAMIGELNPKIQKGQITCPRCGTGMLHFAFVGPRRHVHAKCTTKDCTSFMQ